MRLTLMMVILMCYAAQAGVTPGYCEVTVVATAAKEKPEQLGDEACKTKDWKSARTHYKTALLTDAANAKLHYKYGIVLAMIVSENHLRGVGLLGEMRGSFETSIKLDPKQLDARWALIEYYLQVPGLLGGSESMASSIAKQMLSLSEVDGILAQAHIADHFDRDVQAEMLYQKAFTKFKSQSARKKLIAIYTKNKQTAKADALRQ